MNPLILAGVALVAIVGAAIAQQTVTTQSHCTRTRHAVSCERQTVYSYPVPAPKTAAELRTPSTSPRIEYVRDENPLTEAQKAAARAARPGPREVPIQ